MVWLSEQACHIFSDADILGDSFEPTIVAGLGYAGNRAQLVSVPPYAVSFTCTYFEDQLCGIY